VRNSFLLPSCFAFIAMLSKAKKARIISRVRLVSAMILIALEFTDLFWFLTAYSEPNQHVRQVRRLAISPYAIQFATYAIAAFVIMLDFGTFKRLLAKPVVRWVLVTLALYTWGMIVRTFDYPGGIPDYIFLRVFGLQIHFLVALLAFVVIFDDAEIVWSAKKAVAIATMVGVGLNLYEVFYPETFSVVSGRAAGFYGNSNESGMALVIGLLISLPAVQRRWREAFIMVTFAGVAVTFSREAVLAILVVVVAAAMARALSPKRLLMTAGLCALLFATFGVAQMMRQNKVLNSDTLSRATMSTKDASIRDRLRVAQRALAVFEANPLLGEGFGTGAYWNDEQTHNLYLSLLADYGIIGLLVIPALVWSVRRRSWDSYAFAVVFLLWCFFDHGIFSYSFALISLAIQADEGQGVSGLSWDVRHVDDLVYEAS
jgi:O-antigen ligase